MHCTSSSCSVLSASALPSRIRYNVAVRPTAADTQPLLVVSYRKPTSPRSTGRSGRRSTAQQQPSRPAATPRGRQTLDSSNRSSRRDGSQLFQAAKGAADAFICRHNPFAVGFGCLLVTGYCVVAHGQDVWEALRLAGFSTILGMVMREFLVNNR